MLVRVMAKPRIEIPADRIADFCRKWRIEEFSLFGSVLTDEFRPDSDVDVLVVFEKDAGWDLWDVMHAEEELGDMLGRRVDLVEKLPSPSHPQEPRGGLCDLRSAIPPACWTCSRRPKTSCGSRRGFRWTGSSPRTGR
jgi:hypothetical protein